MEINIFVALNIYIIPIFFNFFTVKSIFLLTIYFLG